jgi:hypothetical protein
MSFEMQRKTNGKGTAYIEPITSKAIDWATGCTGYKAQSATPTTRTYQTAKKADQAAEGAARLAIMNKRRRNGGTLSEQPVLDDVALSELAGAIVGKCY